MPPTSPNPSQQMTLSRKAAIVAIFLMACVLIFIIIQKTDNHNGYGIYKDPNNGEQVAENYTASPENGKVSLVITGRQELIDQGLSSNAAQALADLFTKYSKNLKLASVVKNSVTQYRDNPNNGFSYSFQVQFDKGTYYTVVIDTTDSTTGVMKLYSKDKSKLLETLDFSLDIPVQSDPYAEGSGDE